MRQNQDKLPALLPSRQKRNPGAVTARILTLIVLSAAMLCSSCRESSEQIHQQLNMQAKQYLADKQYAQAISTWNKLLSLQPDAPNIYYKLANSYELNGQYRLALHAFQEHLTRHPESQNSLIHIIKIQLRLFDIAGARTSWEKLKTFPVSPESLTLHGDLLATQEQYIPAIEEYKKTLTLDPTNQASLARLAVILQGQHDLKEAATYYQTLVKQHPDSPDILLQMGNYWLLTGDRKKADLFLQKAVEQTPEDKNLRLKLAELYLDSSRFSQAVAIFKQLLDTTPQNRFYKKMLVESLLQDKQFAQADILLTSLSPAENQDVDFLLLKGKYYLNTGKYLVAASQLELALEKEPRLPLAHYFLALAYLASEQTCLGQKSLIKCLTLNPHFTTAELTLADYYYKTGNYDLALEHIIRIQKREPENFRSFLLQGNILLVQKKYEAALAAFHKAYILNPTLQAPVFYTGLLASFTEKPEQALTLYRSLLARQPLLADATLLYTRLLCKQGNQNKALHSLQDSITAHPDDPYLRHISGLILLSAGKKQEAIEEFETALQLAPDMKETYLQLFKLYQNNPEELKKLLLQAIDKISNFEEALTRLASLYNAHHEPEKAIVLLQEALSRNPGSPILANNLAWLYLEHQPDNIAETMRLASLAYEKLSDNAAIADTLGWVYYKKHLLIRAEWRLEEAVGLEPDNPLVLYHLAVVQLERAQKNLALNNLNKAKSLTKNIQLRQEIEQQLQSVTEHPQP